MNDLGGAALEGTRELQVEHLRGLVPDWRPIAYGQIRPWMRVRATSDGGEAIMTVSRLDGNGVPVSQEGWPLSDWEGAVWHVDAGTFPPDPRVGLLAEALEAGQPPCFSDWHGLARELLARLDALAGVADSPAVPHTTRG